MKVRQAVIMVGGLGTRLRPLTENCPKPVLPVAGKPCIKYLIESMASAGAEDVILACGYRSEKMREALGDGRDLGIGLRYSYEDRPMGTGGALKLLEPELDKVFLASNGDVFTDIRISSLIGCHFSSGADVTVALTPVPNPWNFGVARQGEDGSILEFREGLSPDQVFSDLINAGLYVVDKKVMEMIPEGQQYDFSKELFPKIISSGGKLMGMRSEGMWMDVGRPGDYLRANLHAAGNVYDVPEGCRITGNFRMGEGSSVKSSIIDSSVLMENVSVTNSELKRAVVLGGSRISGARIENSIIGRGCTVCPGSVVTCSVLGDGETVEPGTVRNDGREV